MSSKVNPLLLRLGVHQVHFINSVIEKTNINHSGFLLYFLERVKKFLAFVFDNFYNSPKYTGSIINISMIAGHEFLPLHYVLKQIRNAKSYEENTEELQIHIILDMMLHKKDRFDWMGFENVIEEQIKSLLFNSVTEYPNTLIKNQPTVHVYCKVVNKPYSRARVQLTQIQRDFQYRRPKKLKTVFLQAFSRTSHMNFPGVKIRITGRLDGAERAGSQMMEEGRVALRTYNSKIDYATGFAKTKYGVLGIKVWIDKGSSCDYGDVTQMFSEEAQNYNKLINYTQIKLSKYKKKNTKLKPIVSFSVLSFAQNQKQKNKKKCVKKL